MTDITDLAHPEPTRVGSRVCVEDIWRQAREDFERGHSGAMVCRRYELGKSTFWARAALEGWRRSDQTAPLPTVPIADDPNDLGGFDLANMARARMGYALAGGKSAEAAGWLRLYNELRAAAARYEMF